MPEELEKVYQPKKYEDKIYKKWEELGYFNPDNLKVKWGAKNYSIIMPPPNVTGTLHMGHAAMLAIEDILIRYHRMKGDRTLWIPGTDHAAIATQTKVEKIIKKEGTNRYELGREKFLERVRSFAQKSHNTIKYQIIKMGCSCDWSREAYTLDKTREKAVRSIFKMMYEDGLIYRGERVINWCPRCHSTLADDEVEYKNQKTKLYTFKYDKNFPIAISTTRPETKLGDTAVAVNPRDERYKKYIGKIFKVNFCGQNLEIKIIADRGVDMDFGTGALGVTPAHSITDWEMAEKNKLSIIKVIDENGKIRKGFNKFSELSVKQAREKIIEELEKNNLIIKEEEIDNNLSICYRCDTPVEPLPSLQWFINVNKKIPKYKKSIKELSIEAVRKGVFGKDKIRIYPERFEKNYYHWMENLRDWCISRQIWFGHRLPVYYCFDCNFNEINKADFQFKDKDGHVESASYGPDSNQKKATDYSSMKRIIDEGAWNLNIELKPFVSVEEPVKCPHCGKDRLLQDQDTLDTWFSSGLWTFSTMAHSPDEINIKNGKLKIKNKDFKLFHPTDVLETGYDILFFWVARMIIMTTYAIGDIPFQDVYLHGLVLDDKGKKMSKSKGNVIDPLDMVDKYGTDATRLSLVIGSTPGNDLKLSEEKIASYRNMVNKLWNISRFILSNYHPPRKKYKIKEKNLTLADQWILNKLNKVIENVNENLKKYNFSQAGEKLREFTWSDLADWYLEASKFEKSENKGMVMLYVLENLLKLWHPFTPFVTEKIYSSLSENPIIISKWPKPIKLKLNKGKHFELIKDIVIAIRNARAENKVEPSKKIKAIIYAGKNKELINSQAELIKKLRTGIDVLEVRDKGEKIENAIYVVIGEIEIYLIGTIDPKKEKERIAKEINNLEKVIKSIESKLNNKGFIEKAPKEVVSREKERLEKFRNELKKIKINN